MEKTIIFLQFATFAVSLIIIVAYILNYNLFRLNKNNNFKKLNTFIAIRKCCKRSY